MWRVLLMLLLVGCSPLRGCVESEFEMEPDSRLPRWFPSPPSGADVKVELTLYTNGDALMELFVNGKQTSAVSGPSCWHPIMASKRNANGGLNPGSEPFYTYIRANNILEVIEFPHPNPAFRVSDDPSLIAAATAEKNCRRNP
jgi:hypothetical protein